MVYIEEREEAIVFFYSSKYTERREEKKETTDGESKAERGYIEVLNVLHRSQHRVARGGIDDKWRRLLSRAHHGLETSATSPQ